MSRSATALRPTSPLSLKPIDLVAFTRQVAHEVALGRYPFIEYDEQERWHQRIYRDRRVDLWLISWMPSQGTQLHDHGGSSGAFSVVRGTLHEAAYRAGSGRQPGSLIEQARKAGEATGFGPHYVHDVRNLSDEPAVSVHAYSIPLTSMNYYDLDESGDLQRIASLETDDPEAAFEVAGRSGAPAA